MAVQLRSVERIAALSVLATVVFGCLVVLQPFLPALLWAVVLCVTTWPAFRWLTGRFGGRRTPAAAVMTLLLAVAFLMPLLLVGATLAEQVAGLSQWITEQLERGLPGPPDWLRRLPFIGAEAWDEWQSFSIDSGQFVAAVRHYVGPVSKWLLGIAATLGSGLLELALSVVTAFFFYRDGAAAAVRITHVLQRLTSGRAERLLKVAEGTMDGVVYGIVGTALAQGTLAGLGLWMAGVPGPFVLGLLTMALSLVPFGPPLIWFPASVWLLNSGETAWGTFLILWGLLVVSTVDNIIKPLFIHRGSRLPLLLVLLGIFGGVLSFGFLGIFIGPTLLAIGFTLFREWGQVGTAANGDGPPPPPDAGGAAG